MQLYFALIRLINTDIFHCFRAIVLIEPFNASTGAMITIKLRYILERSKILERLFYVQMETFLNKHDAFSNCQHGFRKSKSTETAIFSFLKDVASSLDQNEATIGIFLDLSKAFDVIDHNILLSKLPSYGIRGIALDWLCSYLKQRSQRVEIPYWNDGTLCTHLSGSLPIVRGVPQGSILGPILFLLYVNDMPLAIRNGRTVLFADDTNILCNKETVNSTISDFQIGSVITN